MAKPYPRWGDQWTGRSSSGRATYHMKWRYTSAHRRVLYTKYIGRGHSWKATNMYQLRKGGRWYDARS